MPGAEPTRARYPDSDGYVERDGVRVFYEVYGAGEPALVFVSGIPFVPARANKAQIPYFARRLTVVAFDGRGGGRSSRCVEPAQHSLDELAGDLGAVMDAAGVGGAVVVSSSLAPMRAVQLDPALADRIRGVVLVAPFFPYGRRRWLSVVWRQPAFFFEHRSIPLGWGRLNARYIRRDLGGFMDWWCSLILSEAHSTRQIEDFKAWASEAGPEALIASLRGPTARSRRELREMVAAWPGIPALVIHGENDNLQAPEDSRTLSRMIGATYLEVPGAGHSVPHRHPVKFNLAVREFVDGLLHGDHMSSAIRCAARRAPSGSTGR